MRISFLILSALFILSCNNEKAKSEQETPTIKPGLKKEITQAGVEKTFGNVTVEEAKKMIAEHPDLVVLDVRTPLEIQNGKIDGAVEMDFNAPDFKRKLAFMDKKKDYLVYCRSGNRSGQAMEMMRINGFTSVKNMIGGYNEWSE